MKIESKVNESNIYNNSIRVTMKKEESRASIMAHYKDKRVGSIELYKKEKDWLMSSYYVDSKYDSNGMIMNRMMSKINEIKKKEETMDKVIEGIMIHLERD